MSAEKTIRYQARLKLKNNGWVKTLIGLGMLAVFYMAFECVASVEALILDATAFNKTFDFIIKVACRSLSTVVFICLCPAILGYFKMMYSDKSEYDMSDVVYYFTDFKRYIKAVSFCFAYIIRMFIPALLCFLPVIAIKLIDSLIFKGLMNDTVYAVALYTLVVLSSIALLIYSIRYFVSVLIFSKDQAQPLSYYFVTSKKIMNGNTTALIKLGVSFTPWILLCITVLPILYVFPYITQAMCLSGKWIYELSRNGQNNELF